MSGLVRAIERVRQARDRKERPLSPGTGLTGEDLDEVLQHLQELQAVQEQDVADEVLKRQKTGSVPRPPGTPLDDPKPKRLNEVIGQLQYFAHSPQTLQVSSSEDIGRFLRAQVDALQALTQAQEAPTRWVRQGLGRSHDVRGVCKELFTSASRVTEIQAAEPAAVAGLLSHWGQTLLPWIDNFVEPPGKTHLVATLEDGTRKYRSPWGMAWSVRERALLARIHPGAADRLLAQLSDDIEQWVEGREGTEDIDVSDRRVVRQLRSTDSAGRMYERYIKTERERSVSPSPLFETRYKAYRPEAPEVPPRPGSSSPRGRSPAPQLVRTRPTLELDTTVVQSVERDPERLSPSPAREARRKSRGKEVVRREPSVSRPVEVLSPSPTPAPQREPTVEIREAPLRHSPPSRATSPSPQRVRFDEAVAVRPGGAAGQRLPGGAMEVGLDTTQPTTQEVLRGTAEFLAQGPLISQVRKHGVDISGSMSLADLAAITADLSSSEESEQ